MASDVLAAYDLEAGDLRVTLARATRYACDTKLDQMKQSAPKLQGGTIRSSLFEQEHKVPPSILSQDP